MRELNEAIVKLISEVNNKRGERFYGYFLSNFKKIPRKDIPTAGVSITDGINLYYNPDFIKSLTVDQRIDLLKHECFHVMNCHPLRFKANCIEKKDHKLFNVACDAAINEPLKSLHEFGVTQAKLNEMVEGGVEYHQVSEYYYSKLKQEQRRREQNGEDSDELGEGNVDDHGTWEESTEVSEELAKEIIKNNMKEAVEKAGGAGNCDHNVQQALNELTKSSVNWKQQLRKFIAKTSKYANEPTRFKRNRRHGLKFPGKRKKHLLTIAVGVDTSGSISNEDLIQFFTEIKKIHQQGVTLKIIEADMQVNAVYDYDPKKEIEIHGRGGTLYNPAIEEAEKHEVDGMIYFGDGDVFCEKIKKPKFPMLWAMVGDNKAPVDWGSVCNVKVNQGN